MTVAEVITTAPEFSTLASVVPNTALEAKLMAGGNTTVFAPNNNAFAKLTTAQIESLIMDPTLLNEILNLHWVDGRVYTGYFYNERYYLPDGSTMIPIRRVNTNTFLGNAKLVTTDISTRNGIIHVIDEVIMPDAGRYQVEIPRNEVMPTVEKPRPMGAYSENIDAIYDDANDGQAGGNLVETLAQYNDLSILVGLVQDAGLANTIAGSEQDLTIFAPTNQAFGMLENNELLALKNNPVALLQVLLNHVIPAEVTEADFNQSIDLGVSLNDTFLRFSRVNSPMVENARILVPNLEATNGMIHVIDQVIKIDR
jgi:uncharacterized surface protein with fasciclin (FAS1) repeats